MGESTGGIFGQFFMFSYFISFLSFNPNCRFDSCLARTNKCVFHNDLIFRTNHQSVRIGGQHQVV